MAATYQAFGATATGTTSLSVAYPTGVAVGDLLVMLVIDKLETVVPTAPTGWTCIYTGTGGTGVAGGGTGLLRASVYVIEAASALSGSLTVTVTSGNVAAASMILFRKSAGEAWTYQAGGGSNATSSTAWSSTLSTIVPFTNGDVYLLAYARSANTTATARAVTATGATFGAATQRGDSGTTTGNDLSLMTATGSITAGTATAAAVMTATLAAATYGVGVAVRIGVISTPVAKRWNPTALAPGTAITSGNVNTAGNGDTVTRQVSGTVTFTATATGFHTDAPAAGAGIARLDEDRSGTLYGTSQIYFTPLEIPAATMGFSTMRSGAAGATLVGSIVCYSTGKIGFQDQTNATVTALTAPIACVVGHEYRMDVVAAAVGGGTTTSRAFYWLQDLTDPTWNTTGDVFLDSGYAINLGTAAITQHRQGKVGNQDLVTGWDFRQVAWQELSSVDPSATVSVAKSHFMAPPVLTTPVTATFASTWSVATSVVTTTSETWNVAQAVTQTFSETWAIKTSVTSTTSETWAVKTPVVATWASTWKVQQSVTKTVSETWAVKAPVVMTSASTWSVKTSAVKTVAETWAVRSPVIATSASTWGVRAPVVMTSASTWSVKTSVVKTVASTWVVTGAVVATFPTTWNTLATGSVVASFPSTWNVVGRVTAVFASTWAVKTSATKTIASTWAVRTPVVATSASTWAVRAGVTKTVSETWAVKTSATKTVASTWNIGGQVVKTLAESWNVRTSVVKTVAEVWAVKTSVIKTIASTWAARAGIVKTLASSWNITGRVSTTRTFFWNVYSGDTPSVSSDLIRNTVGGAVRPPDNVLAAYLGSVRRVYRRLEIYEADGVTPWQGIPFSEDRMLSGSVSIDYTRDERRTFDCDLENKDGALNYGSLNNSFWYDKVLKVYRGIRLSSTTTWEIQLGEFLIDSIKDENFPDTISIACRDFTKKCLNEKFEVSMSFSHTIYDSEILIKTLALRAGILPGKIAITSGSTAFVDDYVFDPDTSMWEAIKKIALNANLEVFFDNFGVMQVRHFNDPTLSPPVFTFKEGGSDATLATYSRSSGDSSIFNKITVRGESSDSSIPAVYAVAQNTNPSSPTNIARLGKRSTTYVSSNVTTVPQAQAIADRMLTISGLEEFAMDWNSICLDWMSVGEIVEVVTAKNLPGAPIRYLLSSLTIPLTLEPMSGSGKRLVIAS